MEFNVHAALALMVPAIKLDKSTQNHAVYFINLFIKRSVENKKYGNCVLVLPMRNYRTEE